MLNVLELINKYDSVLNHIILFLFLFRALRCHRSQLCTLNEVSIWCGLTNVFPPGHLGSFSKWTILSGTSQGSPQSPRVHSSVGFSSRRLSKLSKEVRRTWTERLCIFENENDCDQNSEISWEIPDTFPGNDHFHQSHDGKVNNQRMFLREPDSGLWIRSKNGRCWWRVRTPASPQYQMGKSQRRLSETFRTFRVLVFPDYSEHIFQFYWRLGGIFLYYPNP